MGFRKSFCSSRNRKSFCSSRNLCVSQAGLSAPGASAHKDAPKDPTPDAPVQTADVTAVEKTDVTVEKTDATSDGAGPEVPAGSKGPGTPQTASKRKAGEEGGSPKKVPSRPPHDRD